VGGIKRPGALLTFFNADLAVCDKHRKANKVESMRLIGEVGWKGRHFRFDGFLLHRSTFCRAAAFVEEKVQIPVRAVVLSRAAEKLMRISKNQSCWRCGSTIPFR